MKKLFVITGEHSGDKHAADVVRELKKIAPDTEIEAVGGKNLQDAGVKLYCDHSKMGSVGINFGIILNHLLLGKRLAKYLKNEYKPDMVLMVDYGGFNLNLSKILSKYGIKIYYYIPPQIWASRKWRINTVKKNIKKVLTIFPFEKEMYEKAGIDAEFVGHPLLGQIPEAVQRDRFFEENGFEKSRKLISIFPGSRVFEIKNLLKIFLESAKIMKSKNPDLQFALCQADTVKDELLNLVTNEYKYLDIKIMKNKNYELLSVSDALMLASGTVALEAALYNTPMIISYRGPQILYLIYRLVRCTDKVCLANIITGKEIVPELIQSKANPTIISEYLLKILNDEEYASQMRENLKNVKTKLQSQCPSLKAAEIIKNNI